MTNIKYGNSGENGRVSLMGKKAAKEFSKKNYKEMVERSRDHFVDQNLPHFTEDQLRDLVFRMVNHITHIQTRIKDWATDQDAWDSDDSNTRCVTYFVQDFTHTVWPGTNYEEYVYEKDQEWGPYDDGEDMGCDYSIVTIG